MELDDKERRGYLKDEYLFLQGQYEDFDRRSITIKGWVTSGSVVGLALSADKTIGASIYVPVVIIVICFVVWYLEANWKLFQYALADRIQLIEAYFRDDRSLIEISPDPFQIYKSWFRSFSNYDSAFLLSVATQRFVQLPYSAIIILALCVLFINMK